MLLLGRRIEKLNALAADFDHAMAEAVDVTDYDQFEAAVRKAEAVYGPTELLINNAGVMLLGNVQNQDPREWQTMLDTNVMGVLNGTQIVLNEMREHEHGTILNVSSLAGKRHSLIMPLMWLQSMVSTAYPKRFVKKMPVKRAGDVDCTGCCRN